MSKSERILFEGYVSSYLDKYLENIGQIKVNFNLEFYDYLLKEILSNSMKTLLILLFAFKKENLLKGNSPKKRYDYFDNYSSTKEFHDLVNKMYPLLKLRLEKILHNHLTNYNDLKMRAERDKEELYKKFGLNMGDITECQIEYGISDYHKGLKSTCIIENNGKRIVYKPRSGKIDIYWSEFIRWFNSKGVSLKLDTVEILDKAEYHWQKFIDNKPCKSESEIQNLYYRIGILAAICYVFRVEDLHMENVIVNEDMPYIVDLETVFQIDAFQNSNWEVKSATDILSKNIRKSILSTQLFPTNSKFYNSDVDISGITGKGGQIIKNGKVKILNQFTDEIEVIREDGMTENKSNIGRYGNVVIDPKDYTKEIIEGFREGYVLLENNKEELLKLINVDELFYDACPRYLFRNTNLYATILEMSKNPKYLKDKLEPERLFHLLFNTSNNHKIEKIYQSELGELLNGDIPYFCGCVNDKIIYNFNGDRCFVLDRAPLIEVKERIDNLNQKDMITQVDFIIKSMTIQKKTWNSIREKLDYNTIGDINNKDSLIEAAKNIGDLLISEAIIDEKTETISWLDIQNTFPTWTIRAQDSFLYSGLVGNAIFFSSLYFETKEIKYQRIMEKILNTIRIDLDRINNQPISTFNGIISVAYLYAFLYKQTKDKDMLQESINIIIQNKEKILENTSYDIIDGLAGILIVVLNIYELSEDKELQDLAINIGEKIIKNIQIIQDVAYWEKYNETELIIAGFSHGLAGVTYGLGKLYKKASFKESISLITNLVKIENSYYSNDIENWIDLRSEEKLSLNNSPIHWCHGATGIGLSRLKNKDIMDVSEDLDKAFKTVIKNGLYRDSDCLCHGNMGNIEFLLQIFLESQDRSLYTKIIKRVNEIIIENQCQNGYINGVGQKFSSLSFMLGLPGIGYGMLRISEPEKYPSVLLLEV